MREVPLYQTGRQEARDSLASVLNLFRMTTKLDFVCIVGTL